MRILCLNANRSAARLSGHAAGHEADIVVLQEWADHREDRSATASEALGGLGSVEATRYLATASADDMAVAHSSDRVLVTRHPQGMVVNTYLPSDGRAGSRAEHLKGLSELLSSLGERPVVVAGDFNMAPRPEDGWYGRNHSKYTKEVERAALQALLGEHGLTDLGAGQRWEATFERMNRGKLTSFRCDLALVRQEDSTEWSLAYDHRYRLDDGMSDHSALVLDIGGGQVERYNPHKTAIYRKEGTMSAPARWLLERVLVPRGIKPRSVLDFGAGKSHDPEMWTELTGAVARGYDKHPFPGFEHRTRRPTNVFDLVTMNFVLNILATERERSEALADAASFVAPGGLLWVSTRSKGNIDKLGQSKGWGRTEGGAWISSSAKGTVQFGMDGEGIVALARRSGLSGLASVELPGRPVSDTGCALFRRG